MDKNLLIFNNAFLNLYLDRLIVTPFYTLTFSSPSHSWDVVNLIHLQEGEESIMIEEIETEVGKHQNFCNFWITNEDSPSTLPQLLEERSYKFLGSDIFMHMDKTAIIYTEDNANIHVEQVTNRDQLEIFIDIFKQVHNDVNEVVCGAYRRKLLTGTTAGKTQAFVLYSHDTPVTIGAYTPFQDHAIIHTIATLPEQRKKGFGMAIVTYILQHIPQTHLLLSTEKENPAQHIYAKLGFTLCGEVYIYGKYLHQLV